MIVNVIDSVSDEVFVLIVLLIVSVVFGEPIKLKVKWFFQVFNVFGWSSQALVVFKTMRAFL